MFLVRCIVLPSIKNTIFSLLVDYSLHYTLIRPNGKVTQQITEREQLSQDILFSGLIRLESKSFLVYFYLCEY